MISRRQFLATTAASVMAGTARSRSEHRFPTDPFSLGVASGYPSPTSVVLWTRIAPSPFEPGSGVPPDATIAVKWEVATDDRFKRVVKRGTVDATSRWGHSVHVEPKGLEPDREYWYRFTAAGQQSIVGRTRTAPAPNSDAAKLNLALVSCQQYEHGYFAAYRHILKDNPDLIVHNGDYIYEATWGKNLVRHHLFPEAKTLDDYRIQYALYKSDPDLRAAHAACPWLVTWDDHEVYNDYARDDVASPMTRAQFHQRRLAAYRAYYENMPVPQQAIPTDADMRLYTQRAFGNLASIYLLDQRQYRSKQACWDTGQRRLTQTCTEIKEPSRTMLGSAQEAWLGGALASTKARWNLLVQGTVMSYVDEDPGPGEQFWGDAWNGYPAARRRLMNQLVESKAPNPVVLTGDVHAFIVGRLHREPGDLESAVIASELVTTSVSSEGTPQDKLDAWRAANPNLLLAHGKHRGYLRIEVSRDRLDAALVALDSEKNRTRTRACFANLSSKRIDPGPSKPDSRNKSVTRSPNNGARERRHDVGRECRSARAIRRDYNYSEDRSPMRSARPVAVWLSLFVGLFGVVQNANAWWNDQWAFRKEITFDLTPAGADIPGAPNDVPVLIRLSLANFSYFGDTNPNGSDLRFVAADDKTPLESHIERYDPQAQIAFVWVRVPRLTGGAATDKILLYYGNKSSTTVAAPGGTYDKYQSLVYHFGPAAGQAQDSTANKTEPTAFTAEVNNASLIGSGARFAGAQSITIPATGAARLVATQGYTVSAWVRIEAAQQNAYIAALEDNGKSLVLALEGTTIVGRWNGGNGAPVVAQSSVPMATGEWHHLTLRAANGKMDVLVDGAETATANVTLADMAGTLTIGASAQNGNVFTGEMDELAVSGTARPTEWIKALARSQGMVAPLVVYGGDTQKDSSGGESYFTTTLRNVTIDGWVIIGILMVMFVASVLVMAGKALYLNRVARGNAKFLAEFHRLRDDPAALERRDGGKSDDTADAFSGENGSQVVSAMTASSSTYGVSTLWTLYHHGMRETMKRLEGQAAGADRVRSLTPQSIEAIRATLDASLTRMSQRLSSQMVLLTISISGGPFLGLLGTVVGVMITFAAIAATGDVNINAIAPGTAAALVATVAGLGVAIPCLFGYNYLNTRVKEITADMRVFVDEFVTRIAETYS